MKWTSEKIATLSALWATGMTCEQIGMRLGVSRLAIIHARANFCLPARYKKSHIKPRAHKPKASSKPRGPRRNDPEAACKHAMPPIVEQPGWPTRAQLMAGR